MVTISDTYSTLKSSIIDQQAGLERLTMNKPEINEVIKDIRTDGGESCAGVYRVVTDKGQYALRIANEPLDNSIASVFMQEALSMFGKAPKVYGFIDREHILEIVAKHEIKVRPSVKGPQYGVVMEEIVDSWNYLRGSNRTPEYFNELDKEWIYAQIEETSELANQLRIKCAGKEFLISKEGRPYIIDMDRSIWISEDNIRYGYQQDCNRRTPGARLNQVLGLLNVTMPIRNDFSKELRLLEKAFDKKKT